MIDGSGVFYAKGTGHNATIAELSAIVKLYRPDNHIKGTP
jgi:hypothetical protein